MKTDIPALIDSEKLVLHTLKIVNNSRHFPKKYKLTVVDNIIKIALDIHDHISDANNTYSMMERKQFIEKGIASCRKLKFYIRLTLELFHPEISIPYWDKQVDDIETQLSKWRTSIK